MRSCLAIVYLLVLTSVVNAEQKKFPYEATVTSPTAYARSGPGSRYYPTSKLTSGQKVTVHRHDPGGWMMIAPPKGSFSWVPADSVKVEGNTGTVIVDELAVRVGTEFGENREVEQRRLANGEKVTIIERKEIEGPAAIVTLLKIAPPAYEYRWMQQSALLPVDATLQAEQQANPFATPIASGDGVPPATESQVASEQGTPAGGVTAPTTETVPGGLPFSLSQPTAEEIVLSTPRPETEAPQPEMEQPAPAAQADSAAIRAAVRARIGELDDSLNATLRKDISQWDFDGIEAGYKQLLEESADWGMATTLRNRLHVVRMSQARKKEYDELIRITSETDRRDEELRRRTAKSKSNVTPQGNRQPEAFNGPQSSTADVTRRDARVMQAGNSILQNSSSDSTSQPGAESIPATPGAALTPPVDAPVTKSKFSGAGLLQRSALKVRNAPPFVLLAPDGRVLSYLTPTGQVRLDSMVGKPVGVVGPRRYRVEFSADHIQVQQVSPVQLNR